MKINQFILYLTMAIPLFSKEFHSIQSNYLDFRGKPSHKVFLEAHGINKQKSTIKLTPYFSVSFSINNLSEFDSSLLNELAIPLNLDFYIKKIINIYPQIVSNEFGMQEYIKVKKK